MKHLFMLSITLLLLTSCATGFGNGSETFMRKYNVPITMTSGGNPPTIEIKQATPGQDTPYSSKIATDDGKVSLNTDDDRLPTICYQCAIIIVSGIEVPKNISPTLDAGPSLKH
jgi:hypothetical protein